MSMKEGIPAQAKSVCITDVVALTAFGDELPDLWSGLMAGHTAIGPVRHFPADQYISQIAAIMQDLSPAEPSQPDSRCMSLLSRLIDHLFPVPTSASLITATTKSGIDNLEKVCRGRPTIMNEIVLSAVPDQIAERLGLSADRTNISAACASSTIAVAQAAARISAGQASAVLVCCMDIITEFVFSGFSALKALSPLPCRPFDHDRDGLSLGEGAAALLLMDADTAREQGRKPLGSIVGWGIGNDATHITAPARDGSGLIRTIKKALKRADTAPQDIAAISAHGTGTIYNDAMELKAFQHIFGQRKLPVYSIKGAIGHTMGAAGGIEVIAGLKALNEQTAPPTVGFSTPEPGAEQWVRSTPAPIAGNYLLSTNSGFGGINAAIILQRGRTY